MSARGIAFLTELDACESTAADAHDGHFGDRWLLGRFEVWLPPTEDSATGPAEEPPDSLPIADAIAWALSRADQIQIRDGDGRRWGIGGESTGIGGTSPWRSELAPGFVRRRPADERWKDRTAEDPPIAWVVEVLLGLSRQLSESRRMISEPDAVAAEARATIAEWAPESWSEEGPERYRQAYAAAVRAGGEGFFVYGDSRWSLRWTATAPTAALALGPLRARLRPPPGWEIGMNARPAPA